MTTTKSLGVYVEAWKDGKPFQLMVAEVECGHLMAAECAHQVQEAIRAGRESGLTISISSAWRSHEKQAALYEGWKRREPGFNPANPPGYSNHEDGTAIDLAFGSGDQREEFAAIAIAHGLTRPTAEPWHFRAGTLPHSPEEEETS